MSTKSIRFAQTVNTKQFGKKISKLLKEQYDELLLEDKMYEIQAALDNEDYEFSLMYLTRLREEISLFSMLLEDSHQNISAFLDVGKEEPVKQQQAEPVEKEAEIVSSPKDPLDQLQQIEKLVNVVKSLKGEAA